MTRINLVDAYSNRSVVSKLVNMEERISGAETSVEASAEAAASSASAAAASQTAAKTSETNAKASADTAAATLANTVDLSSKQTVTGAKTFAGDTTVTGSFVTSGNTAMARLNIDTGKLTVGSAGSAEINGGLTASNTANVIKVADHDGVLTSNDVLSARDINTVNGSANNLVHRSGDEAKTGLLDFLGYACPRVRLDFIPSYTTPTATASGWKDVLAITAADNTTFVSLRCIRQDTKVWMEFVTTKTDGTQVSTPIGTPVVIE